MAEFTGVLARVLVFVADVVLVLVLALAGLGFSAEGPDNRGCQFPLYVIHYLRSLYLLFA